MDAITATYDEEYALTANTFTRTGYKFTGWNTETDGSGTSYEDGETVSNLTTTDGETVTLYAQWKEYTITVTEYTSDTLEAEYDYEDGAIILYFIDGFDTAEYAQLGAYEVSTSTSSTTYFIDYANAYASIHEGYTMNATYEVFGYIQFSEVETMSISLYSQLDYWGMADEDSGLAVHATSSVSIIYALLAGGEVYDINGTQSIDYIMDWAVLALVLEYEPICYTIAFDGNGADDGEMDEIEATYDEEYTLTANAYTRDGYTFTGWNTEADGSGTSYEDEATVSNLTTEDGETITLYAQWEPITYTIVFDGNDADDGEMEVISATYDEEYTLTANAFTRDGYTFTGWNTEADGSGTSYEDEATVSNLTTEDGATVTLYAQWKLATVSVNFTKLSSKTNEELEGVEFSLYELICNDSSHEHDTNDDLIDTENYDETCWELIDTYTTATDGTFTLSDIVITGIYRLVETKTVDNYLLPTGQWKIEFDYDDNLDEDKAVTVNGVTLQITGISNPPAISAGDNTIYIYNSTSFDMPLTGAMGIEDYITIGAVIILVGFIGKIHKSKRTVGLRGSRTKVSRAEAKNIKKISKMQKRCRKMQKKTEKMLKK